MCARAQRKEPQQLTTPYPVFILSKGRPREACLNWETSHVFGTISEHHRRWPVVVVVVEPREEEAYREVWPNALMMTLPENGLGPGYARWIVQMVCTHSVECMTMTYDSGRTKSWTESRRLPFVWVADDLVSSFYELKRPVDLRSKTRRTVRSAPKNTPMFREAMLRVQRHPELLRMGLCGFLRDDGTAVCKKSQWTFGEGALSLYKVVLLNIKVLHENNLQYIRYLKKYEDIALNHQVIEHLSVDLMKCQQFCFRASHKRGGGCQGARRDVQGQEAARAAKTLRTELIPARRWERLSPKDQDTVQKVLKWVNGKESSSQQ